MCRQEWPGTNSTRVERFLGDALEGFELDSVPRRELGKAPPNALLCNSLTRIQILVLGHCDASTEVTLSLDIHPVGNYFRMTV